jgi:hypothetical protein
MHLLRCNFLADQSEDQVYERVHRIIVLLDAEAEELRYQLLAALTREFHKSC